MEVCLEKNIGNRGKIEIVEADGGDSGGVEWVVNLQGVLYDRNSYGVMENGGSHPIAEADLGGFGAGGADGSLRLGHHHLYL